jgi:hypothetical protein
MDLIRPKKRQGSTSVGKHYPRLSRRKMRAMDTQNTSNEQYEYVEECVEFTKADFDRVTAILRDRRPYTCDIWSRGSGRSWAWKMFKEALEKRDTLLRKPVL